MKTFKHRTTGGIGTYKDGIFKYYEFCVRLDREPSSEFWEEIEESKKDYEILECSKIIQVISTEIQEKITSVKRLSDGEIFSIGDRVKNPANLSFTITDFYLDWYNDKMLCKGDRTGNGRISINKIQKQPLLLVTQDGVLIYEGDDLFWVNISALIIGKFGWDDYYDDDIEYIKRKDDDFKRFKWFSSKEKAEEYIILNKPCLSIKEIQPIIGKVNEGTYIDLEKLTNKLTELVKSKT